MAAPLYAEYDRIYVQIGRSILAMGLMLTVIATPWSVLFSEDKCDGAASLGIYCLVDDELAAQSITIAILLLVVTGLVPLASSVMHWWLAASFFMESSVYDGGDQIAMIATLLVIPVYVGSPWVWGYRQTGRNRYSLVAVGNVSLLILSLQIFVLYFQAAVSKFGVAQWVDGTAMWYLLNEPSFGLGVDVADSLRFLLAAPVFIAALTWCPIVFELVIGFCQFGSRRVRRVALVLGLLLHGAIAVVMGILSFSIAMVGVLCICVSRGGCVGRRGASDPMRGALDARSMEVQEA